MFFSDDEHTAADWPYPRLMKARKWLYLASGLMIAFSHHRIVASATEDLLGGALKIDNTVVFWSLVVPLTILTAQYALFYWQHAVTYDLTLDERLGKLRSERMQVALARTTKIAEDLADAERELERLTSEAVTLDELIRHGLRNHVVPSRDIQGKALFSRARDLLNKGSGVVDDTPQFREAVSKRIIMDPKIQAAEDRLRVSREEAVDAGGSLDAVIQSDPARRRGFVRAERLNDSIRLLPPIGAAALAWGNLIYLAVRH